nr:zinc-binding protein [uncultured Aminipila sp.]
MDQVAKEYEKFLELFKQAGADELQLAICDSLITECARAKVQLDQLQDITIKTGLVKIHPDNPGMQKTLPVASELSKLRASLTNMLIKLNKILCTGIEEEDDDLEEFE